MDHHTLATISIVGCCLDVLGSLYLAYDLLGGPHGPLRLLTRAVTYSIVFGIGYGLGLGLLFGIAAGLALGITIAFEMGRMSRVKDHYSWPFELLFSAIRAAAFSIALYPQVGLRFASLFGGLLTAGQAAAYSRGVRPSLIYSSALKPRFSRKGLWATLVRTIGYTAAALVCSTFVRHIEHPWLFAIRLGLVTGVVTGVGMVFTPYVEYSADNMPQRRMGVVGLALMFCGFLLQSAQYWVALLDVHLT